MGNHREKPQINRFCTAQKLIWVGAALLAPLVWSLAFSYRPAAVPIQRPVSHPHVAEDGEHTQVEGPGSGEESAQQSGSEDPGPAQAEFSPVANDHGEADGDADHEAAPEELPIVQEDVPIEQLSISRLPPRPDAHCSEDVDASLPEAEQQAAVFACRKAIAREQAEAACAAVGADEEAERFTRGSLDIAALIRDKAGGPGVGVRPNADSAEVRAIPDSIPIAVEPEADVVSSQILANGHWEYHEIRTILTALQLVDQDNADARPPLLLDVGANLGTYSIVAAALGYDVIAFEAMERNVAAIHQTLCWTPELRERITLFPYALGADELSCFVVSDTVNVADGHVVCNEEEVAAMAGALSRATVHSVRLGDYLSSVKADVMKIDVEGYEPHVLAGAGTALDSVQFALTEVSAQDMPKAVGKSFEECGPEYLNSWVDRGFNVSICDAWSNCIGRDVTPIDEAVQATTNQRLANFLMQRHG